MRCAERSLQSSIEAIMSGMALLIIDMLNDFFRQHAHPAAQRTRLAAAERYLDGAIARLLPNSEIVRLLTSRRGD